MIVSAITDAPPAGEDTQGLGSALLRAEENAPDEANVGFLAQCSQIFKLFSFL
jgi:hypothetical protein